MKSSAQLAPSKLTSIVPVTAEMLESSNIEPIVSNALSRAVGLTLDGALFDSLPADQTRPVGLRNGITAIAASANPYVREAMVADMAALAGAVAEIGGSIAYIAAPARAAMINLWASRELPYPVLSSPAVAAADLICVATDGLVSAVDAAPEIDTSNVAVLHIDDARCRSALRERRRRSPRRPIRCGSRAWSGSGFGLASRGRCAARRRWRGSSRPSGEPGASMGKYTDEQRDAILATARDSIELADAALAERKDPDALENILPFVRKPPPEPERAPRTFTDAEVARLIQTAADDLRTALTEQREEIIEWVEGMLIEVTRDYLDRFEDTGDKVISLQGDTSELKRKFIEGELADLKAEVAGQRAEIDQLRRVVEALGSDVAAPRDDVERSAKVVTLRSAAQ